MEQTLKKNTLSSFHTHNSVNSQQCIIIVALSINKIYNFIQKSFPKKGKTKLSNYYIYNYRHIITNLLEINYTKFATKYPLLEYIGLIMRTFASI
jgi:hypothetical protein